MGFFESALLILPALFPIVIMVLALAFSGKSRNRVDWKKIRAEMDDRVEDEEDWPQEEEIPDYEQIFFNIEEEPAEKPEKGSPDGSGLLTEFAAEPGIEIAYEEEGMGEHTAQGRRELHGIRPAWVDTGTAEAVTPGKDRLREAIVFSEIIGPPVAKRKRRNI